jgi:hypothetical protein
VFINTTSKNTTIKCLYDDANFTVRAFSYNVGVIHITGLVPLLVLIP